MILRCAISANYKALFNITQLKQGFQKKVILLFRQIHTNKFETLVHFRTKSGSLCSKIVIDRETL